VARSIHAWSERRSGPLRCINCAAIPAQLIESALFGHERGAFTGAVQQRKGIFEEADKGSILLDEVGDLSLEAQATLLRVLETKQITRVGSAKEIKVDTRVIAATNSDLESRCDSGTFRMDLFYRLNSFTLKIPALRDRPDEIIPLAFHFIKEAAQANRCDVRDIDPVGQKLLRDYDWPGNVRELRNIIERAVVIADSDTITADDLSERIRNRAVQLLSDERSVTHLKDTQQFEDNLRDQVAQYERELIIASLQKSDWNQSTAAKKLGIPIRTLVYKIRKHQIKTEKSRKRNDEPSS
jgi:transcriptional regulator with GAF, ATPase, and Fis domain